MRSLELLERYFCIVYAERTLYRILPKLIPLKKDAAKIAVSFAMEKLNDGLAFVLYDVTTLYFESFTADELRKPGFSKDNKANQPQIVIGLLVTTKGFPLSYDVFSGNTFEGHTMLPILKAFQEAHNVKDLTVVADAGMLSSDIIAELEHEKFSYIVGARLANAKAEIIDRISKGLKGEHGKSIRIATEGRGDLIAAFSEKRFKKDAREMEKQIEKAKALVKAKEPGRRAKFVSAKKEKDEYTLNSALIEKTTKLLGIKGYHTNLSETAMSNENIIERYHDLWQVEQSFRMAKSDLVARPIFHHKKEAVETHMLICFIALAVGKYLEIETGVSLKKIVDAVKGVADAVIEDGLTKQTIIMRSKMSESAAGIMRKLKIAAAH